jgi:hypothetical protein
VFAARLHAFLARMTAAFTHLGASWSQLPVALAHNQDVLPRFCCLRHNAARSWGGALSVCLPAVLVTMRGACFLSFAAHVLASLARVTAAFTRVHSGFSFLLR